MPEHTSIEKPDVTIYISLVDFDLSIEDDNDVRDRFRENGLTFSYQGGELREVSDYSAYIELGEWIGKIGAAKLAEIILVAVFKAMRKNMTGLFLHLTQRGRSERLRIDPKKDEEAKAAVVNALEEMMRSEGSNKK